MNTKMLLYVALLLIAGVVGYWIGNQQSKTAPGQPKFNTEPTSGKVEIDKIIDLTEARGYHKNLKKYLDSASNNDVKKLFASPITIDNAQQDFTDMFLQGSNLGLRMYPGLSYDDRGRPELTFIFIAMKGGSDLIHKKGDIVQGTPILKESAMIQDNNRPCNPCRGMGFANYQD